MIGSGKERALPYHLPMLRGTAEDKGSQQV